MPSRQALPDHDEELIRLQRWIGREIPGRYAELQRNPSSAVSLEDAFTRFEAKHRAALAEAR